VEIRPLSIPHAFEVTPKQFPDDRGRFLEAYRSDRLAEAVGNEFVLAQVNTSVSRRGVVRGIHFADIPPGQAKYVMCPRGAVLDFVIDIRVGSPTFGKWDSVLLDDIDRRAIYLAEGLGHAFVALQDDSTVAYLVSSPFNPSAEHGIDPTDPDIGLDFSEVRDLLLSPKDTDAPGLHKAASQGLLPGWEDSLAFYAELAAR